MEYKFSTLSERDMDLLFLESIGSDKGFAKMIIDKTKWSGCDFDIVSIEMSKTDPEKGESDITVIINVGENKYGILIEDKIDARAMPEQHQRYVERGNKARGAGEYSDFDVIIICPEKYYNNNDEAKKYENHIFYEECENYYKSQADATSKVRLAQIHTAIERAKKPSETILNEAANVFYKSYRQYQQSHYSELNLRTSESSNGWWTYYATRFGKAYIYHKMQEGCVDLIFTNASKNSAFFDALIKIADKLKEHKITTVSAVPTGKSGALRINVPKLNVKDTLFEDVSEADKIDCFEAIKLLSDLADIFFWAEQIKDIKPAE